MASPDAQPGGGPRIAPSPEGGIVLVNLYAWTVVTLMVAAARWIIGKIHNVKFGFDDVMIFGGTIVYTASAVPWHFAVTSGGLGKNFSDLDTNRAAVYFKSAWAAQLLQLAAMSFAKFSSAFLASRVASQSCRENTVLFGMVAFWAVSSQLLCGLQCGFLEPWSGTPKCSHGGPVFAVIALNMVSDALLAWWIVPIIRPLKIDRAKRRTVVVLFSSRAIIPFICIAQLWAVAKAVRGNNPTRDGFPIAILHQTITGLSLIVASLPRIKRWIGTAGSGMLDCRITEHELALSTDDAADSHHSGGSLKLVPLDSTRFTTTVRSNGGKKKSRPKQTDWDRLVSMGSGQDDHTSTSSLFDRQVVMKEITVHVEDNDRDGVDEVPQKEAFP
ncbi:hypothetical protein EJ04DRAFT_579083 [Polyplosphaeria fusca]|uniref:Rhodopsin domain-containing protein n=1 Tax=Polyplosphaeria fusca TaxID=682080 RepID=A0A9P4QPY8_9PLEO|nr:hypothetical protein EJ04DRAFT_579083 [Polyplosphaeria fusca]